MYLTLFKSLEYLWSTTLGQSSLIAPQYSSLRYLQFLRVLVKCFSVNSINVDNWSLLLRRIADRWTRIRLSAAAPEL